MKRMTKVLYDVLDRICNAEGTEQMEHKESHSHISDSTRITLDSAVYDTMLVDECYCVPIPSLSIHGSSFALAKINTLLVKVTLANECSKY